MLQLIQDFCHDMNQTNQLTQKKLILQNHCARSPDLVRLLQFVYDSSYIFHVTSKNVQKYKKQRQTTTDPVSYDLFHLLQQLSTKTWSGNDALEQVCQFIDTFPSFEPCLMNILDKNLKIRLSLTTLQNLYPESFPRFHVCLANSYKESLLTDRNWYISRKLDGVRCCVLLDVKYGSISIHSRTGKLFHTLGLLESELRKNLHLFHENCVLDGEIIDDFEKDNFKNIMEQIHRKNFTMTQFEFRVFDYIPLIDFWKGHCRRSFVTRIERIHNILSDGSFHHTKMLPQDPYSKQSFQLWKMKVKDNDWEGFMLRKNTDWEGKRTNHLLKFKFMNDEEFTVIHLENGPFRIIDQETNLEKTIECLSSVTIDYNDTKIGSGFSLDERIRYYYQPELLLGKRITVKYFEKTKKSLRFPTFKCIRES